MKKVIHKLSIIVCAVVFVYSLYQLGTIFFGYQEIENETEELVQEVVTVVEEEESTVEEKVPFDPLSMTVDFDKLMKKNSDVVGWLIIPDTNINEALLLGETNDTYIKTNINGKSSAAGSLFLDAYNSGDFTDVNTIIYGHNMKNGSRFHNLRYYINKGKSYMEEHSVAYIYLPDGSINVYDIFAASTINEMSKLYNNYTDYNTYINSVLATAKYKKSISDEESPIIMLSTCHSSVDEDRYVVFGKLRETLN